MNTLKKIFLFLKTIHYSAITLQRNFFTGSFNIYCPHDRIIYSPDREIWSGIGAKKSSDRKLISNFGAKDSSGQELISNFSAKDLSGQEIISNFEAESSPGRVKKLFDLPKDPSLLIKNLLLRQMVALTGSIAVVCLHILLRLPKNPAKHTRQQFTILAKYISGCIICRPP